MKKEQLTAYMEYSPDRFTKRNVFKEGGTNAFVLNFQSGQALPSHTHPKASVCLFVLKGKGTFTINNNQMTVEENDILHVNTEDEVGFINDSNDNTSIYVTLNRLTHTCKSSIAYNIIDYKTFTY